MAHRGHLDPRTNRDPYRRPDDRRSGAHRAGGHDDLAGRKGRRDRDPRALSRRALRPGGCVPDVRRRRRRPRVRGVLRAAVRGRDGGQDADPRARAQSRPAHGAAPRRPAPGAGGPEGDHDRRQRAARARAPLRPAAGRGGAALRPGPRRGPLQPGHLREPRRVHPVRSLRPRLRRHPGQRRHRPLGQGVRDPDRLRPRRPDGRVVVRHLRRVRRRLPDRCTHEQADPRRPDQAARGAAPGRHGLPVLRRRLRADVQRRRRARRHRLRGRPAAAGVPQPPVREGPLRLGLLVLAAAPVRAAHPPRVQLPQGPAEHRCAR